MSLSIVFCDMVICRAGCHQNVVALGQPWQGADKVLSWKAHSSAHVLQALQPCQRGQLGIAADRELLPHGLEGAGARRRCRGVVTRQGHQHGVVGNVHLQRNGWISKL